jgi:translation initiation factor 3 subunit I
LKGHERAITFLKYNREGDLLFSCSKDPTPCVWRADTGERLGTYNGHNGTVWSLDVTHDSRFLITGSGDMTAKLWNVQTGEELFSWPHRAPVRSVAFAQGSRRFITVTDPFTKLPPAILIYKLDTDHPRKQSTSPMREIVGETGAKISQAVWGPLNKTIFSVSETFVFVHDAETGTLLHRIAEHSGAISSINFSLDQVFFLTTSDDRTGKLFDTASLKLLKTYETDKPVNAGSISPIKDHVILGGGQKAQGVALSSQSTKNGQFQARFFHMIHEEELATMKGHFGPINAISFSPDGRSFTSGAEDGFLRLHHLDNTIYFTDALDEVGELEEIEGDEF